MPAERKGVMEGKARTTGKRKGISQKGLQDIRTWFENRGNPQPEQKSQKEVGDSKMPQSKVDPVLVTREEPT